MMRGADGHDHDERGRRPEPEPEEETKLSYAAATAAGLASSSSSSPPSADSPPESSPDPFPDDGGVGGEMLGTGTGAGDGGYGNPDFSGGVSFDVDDGGDGDEVPVADAAASTTGGEEAPWQFLWKDPRLRAVPVPPSNDDGGGGAHPSQSELDGRNQPIRDGAAAYLTRAEYDRLRGALFRDGGDDVVGEVGGDGEAMTEGGGGKGAAGVAGPVDEENKVGDGEGDARDECDDDCGAVVTVGTLEDDDVLLIRIISDGGSRRRGGGGGDGGPSSAVMYSGPLRWPSSATGGGDRRGGRGRPSRPPLHLRCVSLCRLPPHSLASSDSGGDFVDGARRPARGGGRVGAGDEDLSDALDAVRLISLSLGGLGVVQEGGPGTKHRPLAVGGGDKKGKKKKKKGFFFGLGGGDRSGDGDEKQPTPSCKEKSESGAGRPTSAAGPSPADAASPPAAPGAGISSPGRPAEAAAAGEESIDPPVPGRLSLVCTERRGVVHFYDLLDLLLPATGATADDDGDDGRDDDADNDLTGSLASLLLGDLLPSVTRTMRPLARPHRIVPLSLVAGNDRDDAGGGHGGPDPLNLHMVDASIEPLTSDQRTWDNRVTCCAAAGDYVAVGGRGVRRRKRRVRGGKRQQHGGSKGPSAGGASKGGGTAATDRGGNAPATTVQGDAAEVEEGGWITFISLRYCSEARTIFLPFAPDELHPVRDVWNGMRLLVVTGRGIPAAATSNDGSGNRRGGRGKDSAARRRVSSSTNGSGTAATSESFVPLTLAIRIDAGLTPSELLPEPPAPHPSPTGAGGDDDSEISSVVRSQHQSQLEQIHHDEAQSDMTYSLRSFEGRPRFNSSSLRDLQFAPPNDGSPTAGHREVPPPPPPQRSPSSAGSATSPRGFADVAVPGHRQGQRHYPHPPKQTHQRRARVRRFQLLPVVLGDLAHDVAPPESGGCAGTSLRYPSFRGREEANRRDGTGGADRPPPAVSALSVSGAGVCSPPSLIVAYQSATTTTTTAVGDAVPSARQSDGHDGGAGGDGSGAAAAEEAFGGSALAAPSSPPSHGGVEQRRDAGAGGVHRGLPNVSPRRHGGGGGSKRTTRQIFQDYGVRGGEDEMPASTATSASVSCQSFVELHSFRGMDVWDRHDEQNIYEFGKRGGIASVERNDHLDESDSLARTRAALLYNFKDHRRYYASHVGPAESADRGGIIYIRTVRKSGHVAKLPPPPAVCTSESVSARSASKSERVDTDEDAADAVRRQNVASVPSPMPIAQTRMWCLGGQGWSMVGVGNAHGAMSGGLYLVCWEGATFSKGSFVHAMTIAVEGDGTEHCSDDVVNTADLGRVSPNSIAKAFTILPVLRSGSKTFQSLDNHVLRTDNLGKKSDARMKDMGNSSTVDANVAAFPNFARVHQAVSPASLDSTSTGSAKVCEDDGIICSAIASLANDDGETRDHSAHPRKAETLLRHCSSWQKLDGVDEQMASCSEEERTMATIFYPGECLVLTLRREAVMCGVASPFDRVLSWLCQRKDYYTAASIALNLLGDTEIARQLWLGRINFATEDEFLHPTAGTEGTLDGIRPLGWFDEHAVRREDHSTNRKDNLPTIHVWTETVTSLADMAVGCLVKGGSAMSNTLEAFLAKDPYYDSARACVMLVAAFVTVLTQHDRQKLRGDNARANASTFEVMDENSGLLWPLRCLLCVAVTRDCMESALLLLNAAIPTELRGTISTRDSDEVPMLSSQTRPEMLSKSIVALIIGSSPNAAGVLLNITDESDLRFWQSVSHQQCLVLCLIPIQGRYPLLQEPDVRGWVLDQVERVIDSEMSIDSVSLGAPRNPHFLSIHAEGLLPSEWLATLCIAVLANACCEWQLLVSGPSLTSEAIIYAENDSDEFCEDGLERNVSEREFVMNALLPSVARNGIDFDVIIPALLVLQHRSSSWRDGAHISTQLLLNCVCTLAGRRPTYEPRFPFNGARVMRQCGSLNNVEAAANLIGGKNGLVLKCCDVLIKSTNLTMAEAESTVLGHRSRKQASGKGVISNKSDVQASTPFEVSEGHKRVLWLLHEHVLLVEKYGDFDPKTEKGGIDPVFAAQSCLRVWITLTQGSGDQQQASEWLMKWIRYRLQLDGDGKKKKRLACAALARALLWPPDVDDGAEMAGKTILAEELDMNGGFLVELAQACCGLIECLPSSVAKEAFRDIEFVGPHASGPIGALGVD